MEKDLALWNCGFLHHKTLRAAAHSFLGGRKGPAALCCTLSGVKRERNWCWSSGSGGPVVSHTDLLSCSTELLVMSVSPWWSFSVTRYTKLTYGTSTGLLQLQFGHHILFRCYLYLILNKWKQVIDLWGTRRSEVHEISGSHIEGWKSLNHAPVFYMVLGWFFFWSLEPWSYLVTPAGLVSSQGQLWAQAR